MNSICQVILGDFNVDILKQNTISKQHLHIVSQNSFSQLINQPTRESMNTSTIVDHVLVKRLAIDDLEAAVFKLSSVIIIQFWSLFHL